MKFEHKCHNIETSGWFKKGEIDCLEIEQSIAHFGASGYRLVSAIPVSDGSVGTKRITLFFEKELKEG